MGLAIPVDTSHPLNMEPAERVRALARAKGVDASDITVCILERPRHEDLIAQVRATGAAIRLITDGDVAGVIHCAEPELTGIDIYMGSGGAPRQGYLLLQPLNVWVGKSMPNSFFRNDDERERARRAGIKDFDRIYLRDELVTADVIFAATGVTQGSILDGHQIGWALPDIRDAANAFKNRVYAPNELPRAH